MSADQSRDHESLPASDPASGPVATSGTDLPTTLIGLSVLEVGYLMGALTLTEPRDASPFHERLTRKLESAARALGVRYTDWDWDGEM